MLNLVAMALTIWRRPKRWLRRSWRTTATLTKSPADEVIAQSDAETDSSQRHLLIQIASGLGIDDVQEGLVEFEKEGQTDFESTLLFRAREGGALESAS